MFVVIVDVTIKKEFVDNFQEAVLRQGNNSITKEKGCLGFEILQDPQNPASFTLYETYTDAATFYDVHRATPHFKDYSNTTDPWVENKSVRALSKLWPAN
jgi:quinol monooxygenase YgiN